MSKTIKQIYASLQLEENELNLLVAEYYNTRFNVLKVERATTEAISDFKVVDSLRLTNDIRNLIDKASNGLGAQIEKVILVLPTYNFKRIALKSKVIPETGHVTKKDVARAISNSLNTEVDDDVICGNAVVCRYSVNGFSTRRIPEKEICDELIVDIDLLCADKDMMIDYVTCVENAGVKVLDVTLNTYAIAKEASLLEESLKQNIIILNLNRSCTYLSLLSDGKFISSEIIFDGINSIVNDVKYRYDIPYEDIIKLIKYDVNFNGKYLDDVIYAYNNDSVTVSLTQRELNNACEIAQDNLVDKLITMCKPILDKGAMILCTGEGQQISSLIDKISSKSNVTVRSYYPDTIGVRDSSLTALYGALFVYREKALLNDLNVNCIDMLKYETLIDQKEFDSEGETITTKIKNLFKQYVEREEK